MKTIRLWVGLATLVMVAGSARADEGMWTFNHFPKELVSSRYHFDVTSSWLDHVRLSSVRFNSGGSGSFVSPRGLVMTNHHVGAECISELTAHDYIKDGFYAKRPADEIKCPDLELNMVVGIEDVTKEVKSVEKPNMSDAALNQAHKEKMSALEKACADKTGERCDVVTLYDGGVYDLYRYKKYTDVRLVFAPQFQIAFFGGDPDNFEYPRYDLDVAFFRVYDGGKEVHPENYLKWSEKGAGDQELVFVSGNPGHTDRLDTMAQLEFLRDTGYPALLDLLKKMKAGLETYAKKSPAAAREARTHLFYIDNSIKALTGYRQGLLDKKQMAKKAAEESALRKKVAASPEAKVYGGAWDAIARSQKTYAGFYRKWMTAEGRRGNPFSSDLFKIARTLVRASAERKKPSEKRLREYRESNLASVELELFSSAPIYPGLEETELALGLRQLASAFGASDPLTRSLLDEKTPEARAHELVSGSHLADVALRKKLFADPKALAASNDPLIKFVEALDPTARALRQREEDEVEGVVKKNLSLLGKARFAAEGLATYPDATFTLRLSFGKVAGYTSGGKKFAPWTTCAGLYARAKRAHNQLPWQIPDKWEAARARLDLSTPLDFVSTTDIIGGNSGSPVINRAGELVGLIFDGNIESLPGNFYYDGAVNRALAVSSQALTSALRGVYDAAPLADEIEPKPARKRAER
ncbi:MAG: S46 family peptidase [Polyangia bacterium]